MRIATRFPLQRLAALDRAVRSGQYPNATSLAKELEVSPRTVQRDIEFFRDRLNAPLEYDPVQRGYFYTDPTYQLPLIPLTEGELVALFLAERVLEQYRGTPYAADLGRAFAKMTAGLTDQLSVDLNHLAESHSFRVTAPAPFEPAVFRALLSAALQGRRVAMEYRTASRDEVNQREFDPYQLASVDGQWFVIGYCHLRRAVKVFSPGRIRTLEITEETFERPPSFRVNEYLGQSFSILRGEVDEAYRVRLRFHGEAVKYIRERTWHASQTRAETPEGDLIVGLTLGHLREVERWVLSWSPYCEVLEPAVLRRRVAEALKEAAHLNRPGRSHRGGVIHADY